MSTAMPTTMSARIPTGPVPLLLCVGALLAAACGDRAPAPEATTGEVDGAGEAASAVPARYLTEVAFVGMGAGRPVLFLHMLNETSGGSLVREYRGWLAEEGAVRPVLRLSDTLPVPRATWRILPGPGLRVRVGDTGEALSLDLAEPRLRLERGPALAEWSGTTGQRELLSQGLLSRERDGARGLLLLRRAARGSGAPRPRDLERVLLLADSLGNGIVVIQSTSSPEGSAAAWTWIDGVQASWTEVRLDSAEVDTEGPDPARGAEAGRGTGAGSEAGDPPPVPSGGWTLSIAGAGLEGRIGPESAGRARTGGGGGPASSAAEGEEEAGAADAPGRRVTGILELESGRTLRLDGFAWLSRLP